MAPDVVFGHEHLVVLAERVGLVEQLRVEVEALRRSTREDLDRLVEVVCTSDLRAEQAEADALVLARGRQYGPATSAIRYVLKRFVSLELVARAAVVGGPPTALGGRWRRPPIRPAP